MRPESRWLSLRLVERCFSSRRFPPIVFATETVWGVHAERIHDREVIGGGGGARRPRQLCLRTAADQDGIAAARSRGARHRLVRRHRSGKRRRGDRGDRIGQRASRRRARPFVVHHQRIGADAARRRDCGAGVTSAREVRDARSRCGRRHGTDRRNRWCDRRAPGVRVRRRWRRCRRDRFRSGLA
jgi:hypothetical protein